MIESGENELDEQPMKEASIPLINDIGVRVVNVYESTVEHFQLQEGDKRVTESLQSKDDIISALISNDRINISSSESYIESGKVSSFEAVYRGLFDLVKNILKSHYHDKKIRTGIHEGIIDFKNIAVYNLDDPSQVMYLEVNLEVSSDKTDIVLYQLAGNKIGTISEGKFYKFEG